MKSSNNPEIIDAPDSILKEYQLSRSSEFSRTFTYLTQLPELLTEMLDKLLNTAVETVIQNSIGDIWASLLLQRPIGRSRHVLMELSPDCLDISSDQKLPNNSLAHVSQEVGLRYTEHECLFGFKELHLF